MKLLLCNQREAGKSILCLDPESEYHDLCSNLGGTYIDMMSGEFMINPLEPKAWSDGEKSTDDSPETFRKVTRFSQHISYLKDFFRAYKDFTDAEVDTIEIMLMKLYARFGIDDFTDFDKLEFADYPIMSDLYELIEKEFLSFDSSRKHLYTEEILQNICLGLHSMCKGAESKYFDGHTNIRDGEFICFGVKGLKSIGKRAFFMYTTGGLTSLNLPASVTKIGEKAFTNLVASSLVLRENLTELGTYLFMDSNTLQNVRVECAEIPAFCFVNCSRLNQLTLSSNVKKIGAHMINYCSLLREITYEGSLADWSKVQKMQNWDGNIGGTTDGYLNKVQCLDGYMEYDRENREWTEVRE